MSDKKPPRPAPAASVRAAPVVAPEDAGTLRALWPGLFAKGEIPAAEALPAPDVDLGPLLTMPIPGTPGPTWAGRHRALPRHFRALEPEFQGRPRITHLVACLIVALRRDPAPGPAWTLFHRIAAEHGEAVAEAMNLRWLTSVCDTFCDLGTPVERATALTGSMTANLVKLVETELWLFYPPRPWPPKARLAHGGPLFDGVISYWVTKGDMLSNLLGRAADVLEDRNPASPFVGEVMVRLTRHDTVIRRLISINDGRDIPLAPEELRRAARQAMRKF